MGGVGMFCPLSTNPSKLKLAMRREREGKKKQTKQQPPGISLALLFPGDFCLQFHS